MKPSLSIGTLAKQSGVKVVTIRYYEQIGLMPVCDRTSANYRTYSQEHLDRLCFLRRCRDLGFSLDEIRNLLRLSTMDESNCEDVCQMAEEHLLEVESKIADLNRLASELRSIRSSCNGQRSMADCRIIAALSSSPAA